MHDTREKIEAKPLEDWTLDELLAEHDRLEKRFLGAPEDEADLDDVIYMIEVGIALYDKGIVLK